VILWLLHRSHGMAFVPAQSSATIVAMTSNFFLNNVFTYRDQRAQGWRLVPALLSFYAICSVGVVTNVGVASFILQQHAWWLAGVAGASWGQSGTSRPPRHSRGVATTDARYPLSNIFLSLLPARCHYVERPGNL
jgi:putative flippase GtrA